MRNVFQFFVAIGISQLAGVIGSIFTVPTIRSGWYAALAKPELAPPNWLFGPVWTTLFALMGVALFLVWRQHPRTLQNVGMLRVWRVAIALFFIQLVLNVFWSAVFFGWRNPGAAFLEILVLWFTILATIVAFGRISKAAAWLLVPYLAWVSFAVYLNFAIWRLN